jgi:dihydrofolate synthase/folylpolyglutamate synthase
LDSPVSARPARFSTLDEWLAWFETLHPKKIDFSLERVRFVLAALGIDAPRHRVITVAGTNGKGSCVALLESVYLSAGYRVGAFTSPHLLRFNERIRIDGRDATDAELVDLFDAVDRALGTVTLSYFESSAVAALLAFARAGIDVAILEVGMGGRLDAVNAIDADAALIVSIDLDHMEWLGPDREAIGREKAGILRAGRPAIIADLDPPASVTETVATLGARAWFAGHDYVVLGDADGVVWRGPDGREQRLPLPAFGGAVQVGNVGAAVAVVQSLVALLPVSDEALRRGIASARLPGRLDRRVIEGVEWIFDVAHNAAAVARLADGLSTLPAAGTTIAVFGAMRDKQLDAVVAPFIRSVAHWHVAPVASERTAASGELRELLERLGARAVTEHADVSAATRAARQQGGDRVLAFGSFYTVGPAMATLGLYSPPHSPRDPIAWTQG